MSAPIDVLVCRWCGGFSLRRLAGTLFFSPLPVVPPERVCCVCVYCAGHASGRQLGATGVPFVSRGSVDWRLQRPRDPAAPRDAALTEHWQPRGW